MGSPAAAVNADGGNPAWTLGFELPTAEELTRLGIGEGETLIREERLFGVPGLARHLLARAVVRRLRDADLTALWASEHVTEAERVRLQAAVRLGAQLTLEAIEAGGDPLLVKNTPGWQLQEVRAEDRCAPQPAGGSGRPLTSLTESLGEVADASLDAGPKRLIEREVITVLAPLALVASGPRVYTTDEARRIAGGEHHLTLEVPAGAQLEVTRVFDRGHAECRPVGADFTAWIRPADHLYGQPAEPVAAPEDYRIGWIQPEDEGRLFKRRS